VKQEKRQCDVLCVGGGIAGLMAAINARQNGASVIVAEKSNTLRSGAGGMGNDHFVCFIPEVHPTYDVYMTDLMNGQMAQRLRMMNKTDVQTWFNKTNEIVKMWDDWGIAMKYHGHYEFAGHAFPGRTLPFLKYSGENQKYILTEQATNAGAEIMNRVMVTDLITNSEGRIIGAVGLSVREPTVYIFECKAAILGTGGVTRLWPSPTPTYDWNRAHPGTSSGDGRIMGFRAGASLQNMELVGIHAGPKYYARAGQATWVGVLKERDGTPVGPFITKPERIYGDITTEVHKGVFEEYLRSGKGPIYMDMSGISDEDMEYMIYWLRHEGNLGLMNHMAEEGLSWKNVAVEFMTFEMAVASGLVFNFNGETSVKGLYGAGDDGIGGISAAATFGWSAGGNMAQYAKTVKEEDAKSGKFDIEGKIALFDQLLSRPKDTAHATWQEVNSILQQVNYDYLGKLRSAVTMDAGMDVLKRVKDKAYKLLAADNTHDLGRCVETLNLIDLAELVFLLADDRKETRGNHKRSDYTLTNPLNNGIRHVIKLVNGKPTVSWEDIK
jgi:succinate dehydrogenase/fumarate reductase flavoprotein subunit